VHRSWIKDHAYAQAINYFIKPEPKFLLRKSFTQGEQVYYLKMFSLYEGSVLQEYFQKYEISCISLTIEYGLLLFRNH
jgi:hypothetical protein